MANRERILRKQAEGRSLWEWEKRVLDPERPREAGLGPEALLEYDREKQARELSEQARQSIEALRNELAARAGGGVASQDAGEVGRIVEQTTPTGGRIQYTGTPEGVAIANRVGTGISLDALSVFAPPPPSPADTQPQAASDWRSLAIQRGLLGGGKYESTPEAQSFVKEMERRESEEKTASGWEKNRGIVAELDATAAAFAGTLLDMGRADEAATVLKQAAMMRAGSPRLTDADKRRQESEKLYDDVTALLDMEEGAGLFDTETIKAMRLRARTDAEGVLKEITNKRANIDATVGEARAVRPERVRTAADVATATTTAQAEAEYNTPAARQERADRLRTEFSTEAKDFDVAKSQWTNFTSAYEAAEKAAEAGDAKAAAVSDQALLASYINIVAPTVKVNSGNIMEFTDFNSLPERASAWLLKLTTGRRFSDSDRKAMYNIARARWDARQKQYSAKAREYTRLARERGVNAEDVMAGASAPSPDTTAGTLVPAARAKKRYNPATGRFETVGGTL